MVKGGSRQELLGQEGRKRVKQGVWRGGGDFSDMVVLHTSLDELLLKEAGVQAVAGGKEGCDGHLVFILRIIVHNVYLQAAMLYVHKLVLPLNLVTHS